jgi:uridine kinase
MTRPGIIRRLAERILTLPDAHPLRVAIDGVDASGKTTLADELADELASALAGHARPALRASIDGFHCPRASRYARGPDSPEGYYLDSYDYAVLRDALLLPLGPGGSRRFRRAVFDFRTDTPVESPEEEAPANAILLMDGVFLLRPELVACWDYRIFVDAPFAVALARALARDVALFGSAEAVRERYLRRYIPGQRLYLESAQPLEHANAIVQNADFSRPLVDFR